MLKIGNERKKDYLERKKDYLGGVLFRSHLLDKTTSVNVKCFQMGKLEIKNKLKTQKNTSILLLFQTAVEGQIF